VNVALVGLGRHGSRYAAHLLAGDVPGLRLELVARGNADAARAFASEHGVRWAGSPLDAVADPGADAVVLCVPPDLTAQFALPALAAGKAVLVEKPLAADLAGALAIERAAKKKGLLMVAQTLRFNSVVRAMAAAAATIGRVHGFSTSQRYEPLPLAWIEDPERGGCLRITGVHAFDLVRHLTGAEVTRVSCRTIPDGEDAPAADHAFAALLHLEPGPVLATVDNSRLTAGRCGRIELVGENGSLVGDHVLGTLVRLHQGEATPLPVAHPVPTVRECLRAFAAAIRGELPVPITATDGRRAVAISEGCRRAARAHREVALRA